MSVPEMQARVKGKIWQAIAQSGVNVSAIPQEEMDKLVNGITESVLGEMDSILGEQTGAPSSRVSVATVPLPDESAGETTLWEGRPFLSLGTRYTITSERVRITEGVLGKDREDIELIHIQDMDQTQSLVEQMFNLGDIHIRSHDPSSPEVVLNNIPNAQDVNEILRAAVLNARKRHGLQFREQM